MTDRKFVGHFNAKAILYDFDKINGKNAIRVLCEVQNDPDFNGRRIEWTGWLTENAIEMTAAQLRTMGWDGVSLLRLKLSQQFSIKVEEERATDGKVYPRVRFINPIRTLRPSKARVTNDEIASLDRLLATKHGKTFDGAAPADDDNYPPNDDYQGAELEDPPFDSSGGAR
jgi:hypothetical protein